MKVTLVTTPIRNAPTSFPPIGSLSLISYLRKQWDGEIDFYHIDGNRPDYEEVLAHIREQKPAVLGISAVVSTAYGYTKKLSLDVKAILPDTIIIVGGSLAASAEILLRRTGVDLCCLSEGEKVFANVVKRAETTRKVPEFADIPGLMLLDDGGNLVNTGYESPLGKDEVYDIDWNDLENATDNMGTYIMPAFDENGTPFPWFAKDPRTLEPHRAGKMIGSLPGAKGCVARCTFCHRWDKGIRYIPVDLIMKRLEYLIEHYNVGFLSMADENFGTDKRWLTEFCEKISKYDILWQVAGMRVNCVDRDRLQMMRDAGCAAIAMGLETGSENMLKIMEKKVKLQNNYDAVQWAAEIGIEVTPEIIVGMPGETSKSIEETARFVGFAKTRRKEANPMAVSINYAQALPGTPLYEFARRTGLVTTGVDGEEDYLAKVSDQDASHLDTTINFSNSPNFIHRAWRAVMLIIIKREYVKKFGIKHYHSVLATNTKIFPLEKQRKTYFDNPVIDRDLDHARKAIKPDPAAQVPSLWWLLKEREIPLAIIAYPHVFHPVRKLQYVWSWLRVLRAQGAGEAFSQLATLLRPGGRNVFDYEYKSLRKIVDEDMPRPDEPEAMIPLREGR